VAGGLLVLAGMLAILMAAAWAAKPAGVI